MAQTEQNRGDQASEQRIPQSAKAKKTVKASHASTNQNVHNKNRSGGSAAKRNIQQKQRSAGNQSVRNTTESKNSGINDRSQKKQHADNQHTTHKKAESRAAADRVTRHKSDIDRMHAGRQNGSAGNTASGQYTQKQFLEQPQPGYFVQQVSQTDQNQGKPYTLTKAQRAARRRRIAEMKRRRRNRRIIASIIFLLVLLLAFLVIRRISGTGDLVPADELDIADLDDEDEEEENYTGDPIATILFAGDISTSADQVNAVSRSDGTYDFSLPFSQIASYIEASDYAVADFETCMIDDENYGTQPYYNSPVQLAGTLRSLGFRLMSTANTYALNNGIDGINETIDNLTGARLKHVGTYQSQAERDSNGGAYIRKIHGIKFAFLSYTKGTDSVMLPDECSYALNTLYTDYSDYWSDLRTSQIQSDVQAAKDAGAEVIIALLHWGSEYSRSVTPAQDEVAELLLSNGVDVIIGTHSHVVSEMSFQTVTQTDDTEKECFVAYGIGDFYTDPEQDSAYTSMLLSITFTRNDDNSITMEPSYVPIYMHVSQQDNKRNFEVLDTYHALASLYRQETLTSADSELFNALLDSIDTLHTYAGTDYDVGLREDDQDDVQAAMDRGPISEDVIDLLKEQEDKAAEEAAEEAAAASEAAAAVTDADGDGIADATTDTTAAADNTETDAATQ